MVLQSPIHTTRRLFGPVDCRLLIFRLPPRTGPDVLKDGSSDAVTQRDGAYRARSPSRDNANGFPSA